MTKQEAIEAMQRGEKVTHRYFSDGESMTMIGPATLQFEDGVKCSFGLFWYDRPGKEWNNDWELIKSSEEVKK
jgi:hypothetical protein